MTEFFPAQWLEDKFAGYVESQEKILKERLEKIQYDIDALETVALVLRGDRIEQVRMIPTSSIPC